MVDLLEKLAADLDRVCEDHDLRGIFAPDRAVSGDRRCVKLADDIGHGRCVASDFANDGLRGETVRVVRRRILSAKRPESITQGAA